MDGVDAGDDADDGDDLFALAMSVIMVFYLGCYLETFSKRIVLYKLF